MTDDGLKRLTMAGRPNASTVAYEAMADKLQRTHGLILPGKERLVPRSQERSDGVGVGARPAGLEPATF